MKAVGDFNKPLRILQIREVLGMQAEEASRQSLLDTEDNMELNRYHVQLWHRHPTRALVLVLAALLLIWFSDSVLERKQRRAHVLTPLDPCR